MVWDTLSRRFGIHRDRAIIKFVSTEPAEPSNFYQGRYFRSHLCLRYVLFPPLSLVPQAKPYHYKDRAIILGDAAHSMVPFYGQGLNCGLEDVRVLTALLHEAGVDPTTVRDPEVFDLRLAGALSRYSESRHEDLIAINDLAMDN